MPRAASLVTLIAIGSLWALSGCSPVIGAYVDARDDWTESTEVWEDMESRFFIDATLKNKAFREQYVREYARLFSMHGDQQATLLEAELAEEAEHHVVASAMFFADRDWERLDPKYGIWDVRLENDAGQWVRPLEVKKLDTDNPLWRRMYPYLGRHDLFFELHFPKVLPDGTSLAEGSQQLHLVISGAPAQVKLTWPTP